MKEFFCKKCHSEFRVDEDLVKNKRCYEKVGFVDSGYIDECVPDCLNLIYYLR